MAGRKAGVQLKLLEMNPNAVFIPCDNHSLNLVCGHAAETSSIVVTRFGTVQEVFVFFSAGFHASLGETAEAHQCLSQEAMKIKISVYEM